jgi:hypothetical protein
MKKPSHATLTTPPLVEYVAVGRVGARVVGVVVGVDGAATVVVGEGGGLTAAGVVPGGVVVVAFRGTVVVGRVVVVAGLVVLVAPASGAAWSWLTTSRCGTTGAGRSLTSVATIDVAVHTIAVDTRVARAHKPVANSRGIVTGPRMPAPGRRPG